mmetsp:Transcript_10802/g.24695  ORF Transcript_10802/g.24695 Transcript_10802/m.24695 type:complete len:451 (+) Transcript_10802:97-1449(+)
MHGAEQDDGREWPDALEVQARLLMSALVFPTHEGNASDDFDEAPEPSPFQSSIRDEVLAVLTSSLSRRQKSMEKKVQGVSAARLRANGSSPGTALSAIAKTSRDSTAEELSREVQTDGPSLESSMRLSDAVASAVTHARRVSQKPVISFGPSKAQQKSTEPPEKRETMVKECETLRDTLSTLGRSVSSRIKQIASLKQQLKLCEDLCADCEQEAEKASSLFKRLQKDPSCSTEVRKIRLERRKARIQEMQEQLQEAQEQEKRYKTLAQHQRAYFIQSDRISVSGGPEAAARHPCGEIFLPFQPMEIEDEQPKFVWDIGTAIANPYVVDSWPFEPNVLARRTSQETSEGPIMEEDEPEEEEDDDDEVHQPHRRQLHEDNDDEEEYEDDAEIEEDISAEDDDEDEVEEDRDTRPLRKPVLPGGDRPQAAVRKASDDSSSDDRHLDRASANSF